MKKSYQPSNSYMIGCVLFSGAAGFAAALTWHVYAYLHYTASGFLDFYTPPLVTFMIPCALAYLITRQLLIYLGVAKATKVTTLGLLPAAIGVGGVCYMAVTHVDINNLFATYTGEQWWEALIIAVLVGAGLVSTLYMVHAREPKKVRQATIAWRILLVATTVLAIAGYSTQHVLQEAQSHQSVVDSYADLDFTIYKPDDSVFGKYTDIATQNIGVNQSVRLSYNPDITIDEFRQYSTDKFCQFETIYSTPDQATCFAFTTINGTVVYTDKLDSSFFFTKGDTVIMIDQDALRNSKYAPIVLNSAEEIQSHEADGRLYAVPALEKIIANLQPVTQATAAQDQLHPYN